LNGTPIDTSRTIEIEIAPATWVKLIGLSALCVFVSASIAFDWIHRKPADSPDRLIGWWGLAVSGPMLVFGLWRLLTRRGPVVTISPEGIRDIRIQRAFIPWNAVRGVATWEYGRSKFLVLALDPAVQKSLPFSWLARLLRGLHRLFGPEGLYIVASGLSMDFELLVRIVRAYARQHGAPSA
jgi:hypothetical protein